MEENGEIDLYYMDESGFSLNPVTSYAWQPKGSTIEVPTASSVRLNVLGLLRRDNKLESYIFPGTITSDVVIECLNLFSSSLQKKTLVVLDNATIHTSDDFDDCIDFWQQRGLFLYYLPTYSPELNLIEILWRFIKYFWLPFSAYLSFSHLSSSLDFILSNFGSKYLISFA
jgi:transposase